MSGQINIVAFRCRSDNVGVLVRDPVTGATAAIDAPEEAPIVAALMQHGWTLTDLLITHHHHDHVEALPALKAATGCRVVGPRNEADRIGGIDFRVGGGDHFKVGALDVEVIDLPGHTAGHVGFHFPGLKTVFAADTLFEYGCGRLFEGTPADMWGSLQRLAALPDDTTVYYGHDYGLSNGRFAVSLEPGNTDLAAAFAQTTRRHAEGIFHPCTTLGLEKRTNPFLRAGEPSIQAAVGLAGHSPAEVLGEVRERKNKS